MSDRITAADVAQAIGSRKTRELLGIEPVGDVTPKRRHKYNARRTQVDGIWFHSAHEAERYGILKTLAAAGKITGLKLQVPIELDVSNQRIAIYVADFTYWENGVYIVEDAKGVRTAEYKIKAKLVKALYGIEIRET